MENCIGMGGGELFDVHATCIHNLVAAVLWGQKLWICVAKHIRLDTGKQTSCHEFDLHSIPTLPLEASSHRTGLDAFLRSHHLTDIPLLGYEI